MLYQNWNNSKLRTRRIYTSNFKEKVRNFRKSGFTHREIEKQLGVAKSTIVSWTKDIKITHEQHCAIEERRHRHRMTQDEKIRVGRQLLKYQYKRRYSDDDLIQRIKKFHRLHRRIPLKREFNALRIYRLRFGTWNNAIKLAGFETNPILFAKKFIAQDGHKCDSFTEKIIDDWFNENNIFHERNFRYGDSKMTADFYLGNDRILEFFGLAHEQKAYDKIIQRKRALSQKLNLRLIEVYPEDIYPNNKLKNILK